MRSIDQRAPVPVQTLIDRAGWAVAAEARSMLGGSYGRRVTVLVGKGNNGADGRAAAGILRRWGVRVLEVPIGRDGAERSPDPESDLVVDAAFGAGFAGQLRLPQMPTAVPVLAVDVPSGLNGDTGIADPATMPADRTVSFVAPKPGHYLNDGPRLCGRLVIADIGLDPGTTPIAIAEESDLELWPRRIGADHKWRSAVWLVAGSPGMTGAASLAATAAFRAGAGYVTISVPGTDRVTQLSGEPLPAVATAVADVDPSRYGALVVGPGLTDSSVAQDVLAMSSLPAVVDAGAIATFTTRDGPTVLTPHDGEFRARFGQAPGPDRIAAAGDAARQTGAVVLLKGPTTVVADPGGSYVLIHSGDARLATAGTGDVLSGIIGAGLAHGLEAVTAASLGALLHAVAATGADAFATGFMASDLPLLAARTLDRVHNQGGNHG